MFFTPPWDTFPPPQIEIYRVKPPPLKKYILTFKGNIHIKGRRRKNPGGANSGRGGVPHFYPPPQEHFTPLQNMPGGGSQLKRVKYFGSLHNFYNPPLHNMPKRGPILTRRKIIFWLYSSSLRKGLEGGNNMLLYFCSKAGLGGGG